MRRACGCELRTYILHSKWRSAQITATKYDICQAVIDKVSLDSDRVIEVHSIELELVEGASQEMEDRDWIRVLWPVRIELTFAGWI